MDVKKCFLRPADGAHEPITLKDKTPRTIGRGPVTGIKDSRCSRNQLMLVPDFERNTVTVTLLGRNLCGLDGVERKRDEPFEMKHGQKLDVVLGQYSYFLEFDPPPGKKSLEKVNDVSDSDDDETPIKKKAKTDDAPAEKENSRWQSVENELLIYLPEKRTFSARVAAFDLDHTVIEPRSGGTFPRNENDWKLLCAEVLTKFAYYHDEGYKIVIFSNQSTLVSPPITDGFKRKIEAIASKIKTPFEVYVARSKGKYRKPCIGMWEAMAERNDGVEINMKESFYCGDAAGRQGCVGKKTDFSQSDVLFARNLKLKFYTPEEHFLNQMETRMVVITAFDPSSISMEEPLCDPDFRLISSPRAELVLLVGCPGSGKSRFSELHMAPSGYERVNRDELGNMSRCFQAVTTFLQLGKHVVVDNTNHTVISRAKFIEIANKYKVAARAFVMKTSKAHAMHNNKFRQLTDSSHAVIGEAVIHSYFKQYEAPTTEEGFSEIVKINFWPSFRNSEEEKLYYMFLTEK